MDCCHHCNYYYTDCPCQTCGLLLGLPPDTTAPNYIPLTCNSPTVAAKPAVIEYVLNSQGASSNPEHRCYGLSCQKCEETTNYATHNDPEQGGNEQDHLERTNARCEIIDLTREEEIIDLTNSSDEDSTDEAESTTTMTFARVNIQRSGMTITIKF